MDLGFGRRVAAAGVALFATVFLCACLEGQARASEPGEELTIAVLTFGPGDHPFYKFGHDAIWVHDARRRRDDVYNYGTFAYRSATLIPDFLEGRLKYWLSVEPLEVTLAEYRAEGRSALAQELALTPAERRAMLARLQHDARPENREYRYDYYRDNCATRVRDVVDDAIGGRLRAASGAPASLTFRGHTERLTADDLLVYLGLDVAMGDVIDAPVTQWEEMFLPSMLEERLRHATVPGTGAPGASGDVPLVARETLLLATRRPPLRSRPPQWTGAMGAIGTAIGAALVALAYAATRSRAGRVAFGAALAALGIVAGLLGTIFVFFWAATDHAVAHHNENILQLSPLGLAMAVAAIGLAAGSTRVARAVPVLTAALALSSLLGLALKVLPWFDQENAPFIALFVPIWVGAAWAAAAHSATASATGSSSGGGGATSGGTTATSHERSSSSTTSSCLI
jgi:hypothetical protein